VDLSNLLEQFFNNVRKALNSPTYEESVEQFAFERSRPNKDGKYFCPCINCLNGRRQVLDNIQEYLLCDGIKKNYTTWI